MSVNCLEQLSEKSNESEIATAKLATINEEFQLLKTSQTERNKDFVTMKSSLQTLQQKYDSLLKNHQVRHTSCFTHVQIDYYYYNL